MKLTSNYFPALHKGKSLAWLPFCSLPICLLPFLLSVAGRLKLSLLCLLLSVAVQAQPKAQAQTQPQAQDFYKAGTVVDVKLYFQEKHWDTILDSLKQIGNDERLAGDALINGVRYKGVGVRYKGNSSYFSVRKSGSTKLPFNIKINFTDKDLELPGGFTAVKLANAFRDPSFLREVLAYEIAGRYMAAPQANFARLYVNDAFIGLYHNTESVDRPFLQRYFDNGKGTLIKCDPSDWNVKPPKNCPPSEHASLQYLGEDSLCYQSLYELEEGSWSDLIDFTAILNRSPEQLESVLNIDQALWMLAFNNLTLNLDSYLGKFCHNYYLYKDSSGIFHPVIWDLNMAFGGFRHNGIDEAALSDEKMQTLSPFLHYLERNPKRPLILQLLSNDLWRKIYVAHIRTMLEDEFANGAYLKRARELQKLVDPIVQKDLNKLYDYEGFRQNIDSTARADKSNIIGIAQLMGRRAEYLAAHPLLQKEPPRMGAVKHTAQNTDVLITANVENARRVWVFSRQGKAGAFQKTELSDDGEHNDGAAADNLWAITLPYAKGMQYYIVAEDDRSAILSPRRAALECYEVK